MAKRFASRFPSTAEGLRSAVLRWGATVVWGDVDERIHHQLPGTVIGDVATSTGLVNLDTLRTERLWRREHVLPATRSNPERQNGWVLQEEQGVGNVLGSPLLDELPLERNAVVVRHATQSADVERSH